MKGQKSGFSKEELKSFISGMKEGEIREPSSLNHLIGDVLEPLGEKSIEIDPSKRREEKPKKKRIPLLLCGVALSAFFFGSLFGFVWGKNQESSRLAQELFKRDNEIFYLSEQLKKAPSKESQLDQQEWIEPFFEQSEFENLSTKKLS